eukprot:g1037.t1
MAADHTLKIRGSPLWMAPEVLSGRGGIAHYSFPADVYSTAIVVWQILSLDVLFEGYSVLQVMDKVERQGLRPPVREEWSKAICDAIRSGQTIDSVQDPQYWRSLVPALHCGDDAFAKKIKALHFSERTFDDVKRKINREGFVYVESSQLSWETPAVKNGDLAAAVMTLGKYGWPPSFVCMYDEAWSLVANISDMMKRCSGGNACNFDILAWHIDPRKDEAGFSPHRDRQPEDVSKTFRKDGSAKYTTCWIALADATPENSCLYMIPRFCDPGYLDGDDMSDEEEESKKAMKGPTGPLWRALSSKEAFQYIRAVPAPAGSAVVFTHRTIHWGSRGRDDFDRPRISFSFAASDDTFEAPYISRDNLPFPSVPLRLALTSAQQICYHDRFNFETEQLKFFNCLFKLRVDDFHASYRTKVVREFLAASEATLYGARGGQKRKETPSGDTACSRSSTDGTAKKSREETTAAEDDDLLDDALDAMLDAQLAGGGSGFRDDYDDAFGCV